MTTMPSYVHPLPHDGEPLPEAFTYPFRYEPHPLCLRAAAIVQAQAGKLGLTEGKMFGVLVVSTAAPHAATSTLYFLAAYSGQIDGSFAHPWFVPPIVDYLQADSHFQRVQRQIEALGEEVTRRRHSDERRHMEQRLAELMQQRDAAVARAKAVYAEGKAQRDALRRQRVEADSRHHHTDNAATDAIIRDSQRQKADIRRARQQYADEIAVAMTELASYDSGTEALMTERHTMSDALQQWLFRQFSLMNARGQRRSLVEVWAEMATTREIPSGTGECCAPKLLQAAYRCGLRPVAMAEFWWGTEPKDGTRSHGRYYPACNRKCRPILAHMLQGLTLQADPAAHYDRVCSPLRVVWEDEWMAIIDKPAGWLSVAGVAEAETSPLRKPLCPNVEAEAHRRWPAIEGCALAHRLDQDTSGLLIVAKRHDVRRRLTMMFEQRQIAKTYMALLDGHPQRLEGRRTLTVSLPLSAVWNDLPRQRIDAEHGAEAITQVELLGYEGTMTRVALHPLTGRTHQLRLHCAADEGLATPIVGDRLYGRVDKRMCLHAMELRFTHPMTGEELHFCAECPF